MYSETEQQNKYLLIVADYFTKWTKVFPIRDQEATTVTDIMVKEIVSRYGVPLVLHADQGRNFEYTVIAEMCRLLGIEKIRTTPLHPQSDGMVERFNRILKAQLAKFVSKNQRDWDHHLQLLMMAYRTSVHDTTGETPAMMMIGRNSGYQQTSSLEDRATSSQCTNLTTPEPYLTAWKKCMITLDSIYRWKVTR